MTLAKPHWSAFSQESRFKVQKHFQVKHKQKLIFTFSYQSKVQYVFISILSLYMHKCLQKYSLPGHYNSVILIKITNTAKRYVVFSAFHFSLFLGSITHQKLAQFEHKVTLQGLNSALSLQGGTLYPTTTGGPWTTDDMEHGTDDDTDDDMDHNMDHGTDHNTDHDMDHGTEHGMEHDTHQNTHHDTVQHTDHGGTVGSKAV